MPAPTRLGANLAARAAVPAAAPAPTPLKRGAASGRRGEEVVIPLLGRVYFELPGAVAWAELEAAARREVRRLGYDPQEGIPYAAAYEAQIAVRVLAASARDPDDHGRPFGTLEEWGEVDNDVVNVAWHAFGDVRERLDPIALPVSSDDAFAIQAAVKKKDAALLRTFGVAKLSAWLATTDDPPSTSLPPSSPSTESSSE